MSGNSENDEPRHRSFTLYLDENYDCPDVKERLFQANIRFRSGLFSKGTDDVTILREVGRRGWILITTDSKMQRRGVEKEAVLRYRVRLFVFTAHLGNIEMANAIIRAKNKMRLLCREQKPGFSAVIHKSGKVELRMDSEGKLYLASSSKAVPCPV